MDKHLDRYEKHFGEPFPRRELTGMTELLLKRNVEDCIEENLTYYELLDKLQGTQLDH